MTPPTTPHAKGLQPLEPAWFVEAVDMGLSFRNSLRPSAEEDFLQGSGSLLLRYARSGVFLRAMPRPAKLSRCNSSEPQPEMFGLMENINLVE